MTDQIIEHPVPYRSVLVVVDVQGRLARLVHESDAMIRAQQTLIQACRLLEIPVVWAEQLSDKLGPTVDELQEPLAGLEPCAKSSFGCIGCRAALAYQGQRAQAGSFMRYRNPCVRLADRRCLASH